ncbi:MAG: beta galactosidase jelly roll domain-containing protein [Gammaproteobacteria bacterium]|nr:beta galactosidase jelly roll domain-containing protein [Gammaproteobacteria bacterium]
MTTLRTISLALLIVFASFAHAALELPLLFSDEMVLQRNQPIHVWGWSEPGSSIHVQLDQRNAKTKAAGNGSWHVYLPKFKAGGPYILSVDNGTDKRTIKNVLVGDVWLCSGQSNMEWTVKDSNNAKIEMASANDSKIRHFKIPKSWANQPEKQLAGGSWQSASPKTVGDFTAVGYFFARELRAKTGVPIGLINSSWGGSRIEPWMSINSLDMDEKSLSKLLQPMVEQDKKNQLALERKLAHWSASAGGIVNGKAVWANANLDDSNWANITVPALWEAQEYIGMDGIAWYRTTFTLTAEQAKNDITLGLGPIDDSDQTWVNGVKIGETIQQWNVPRRYSVSAKLLKSGVNTIAVRVEDSGGGGGIHGDPNLNFVRVKGGAQHQLSGNWKFRVDKIILNPDDNKNQIATLLYNKMIYPIQRYPIKGVIWYQGEANATVADAYQYRNLFVDFINSWRQEWKQKNMPFLWVQLANWISGGDNEHGSPWAVLRESQSSALSLPNTAEAVTIDIGNPNDIHPRNKQDVGHRLALAARHVVYGEDSLLYSGPRLLSHRIKGNQIELKFQYAGTGLQVRGDGPPAGFTIAAADKQFLPAEARIEGDIILVSHPDITKPAAVRYAWSDNPETANLMNSEALPASPFRTDDWDVLKEPTSK